jgi:predicted PurR-regulated permease PerM
MVPRPKALHAWRWGFVVRAGVGYRVIALAAALLLAGLLVQQLMTVLLAGIVTVILALPLAAAADWARRVGLPRFAGALAALVVITAVLVGVGVVLVPQFVSEAKAFAADLPAIVSAIQRRLSAIHGLHVQNLSAQLNAFITSYSTHPQKLVGPLETLGATAVVLVIAVIVVVAAALALAINPDPVVSGSLRLVPLPHRPLVREVLGRVRTAWLGWMTAVCLDMLVLGSLLYVGMLVIGLQFAIGFAVFSALMTVIPNYGSIISAIPPILAGLAKSPGEALLVLLVYVIVNQIEGNLILPLIMARTVDMHPAVVTIGLLVMAALFGLIGVFIAIPLLSLVIIVVQALWVEPMEAAAGLTVAEPPAAPG